MSKEIKKVEMVVNFGSHVPKKTFSVSEKLKHFTVFQWYMNAWSVTIDGVTKCKTDFESAMVTQCNDPSRFAKGYQTNNIEDLAW